LLSLRSWALQEPQTECREHQDNSDIYDQPFPEVVPEEQEVYADHDGYQHEHVKHGGCLSSHRFLLLGAANPSKSGAGFSERLLREKKPAAQQRGLSGTP
jgi:hypothetical protein